MNYEYFAAMLSFIGCRNIAYLREQLNGQEDIKSVELYESSSSIHLLTKRMDISRMLDEMMSFISSSSDYSA